MTAVQWLIDRIDISSPFMISEDDIQKAIEMEKQQTEISDEYIDERAESHSKTSSNKTIAKTYFKHGARWYREHLKQRQCNK
jgi:hypothetical protein